MLRYLVFILVLGFLTISCLKKEEKVEIQIPSKRGEVVSDVELKKWKEEIYKPSYRISLSNLKNPFFTTTFMSQKEEHIPLELVGIINKRGEKWALIQDAARKGYILKVGSRLGSRKILDIGENYVLLEEEVEDIFGEKVKNIKKITLKKEKI